MAQIVRSPDGQHQVAGTEVVVETVVERLRTGQSRTEIFSEFPTLPNDAIDVIIEWAYLELGPSWMAPEAKC